VAISCVLFMAITCSDMQEKNIHTAATRVIVPHDYNLSREANAKAALELEAEQVSMAKQSRQKPRSTDRKALKVRTGLLGTNLFFHTAALPTGWTTKN
jgi:hypothetical protein